MSEQEDQQLTSTTSEISTFEEIFEIIGNHGTFQQYFNWIFNFAYTLILAMTYLNHILAVATPEHWCHVPGRPKNISTDAWRILTIPREINTKGEEVFSKCFMYENSLGTHQNDSEIIGCQYGWEYNRTWYQETLTSSENWVCENEYYVTRSLTLGRLGDLCGTLIFGYLGDIIGRRPIFLITVIGVVLTRCLMLLVKWQYYLFMFISFFSSLTLNAGFQSPLTIILEICNVKHRASVVSLHYIGWALGVSTVPLIMWAVGRADLFIILTTVPGLFVLISYRYLIESPRWLLSRQNLDECYKQLKVIAKVNNKKLPNNIKLILNNIMHDHQLDQPSRNFLNLFSNWRLAKNTFILCICWSVTILYYNVLIYYIEILDGNPFLNFFFQSFIQLPAHIVGKILANCLGRRLSFFLGNFGTILTTLAMILLIKDTDHKYISVILTVMIKFFLTISYNILNLQTLEIYPTCLRQTGTSICLICALATTVAAPNISWLGRTYDAKYPYLILFIGVIISTVFGTFLPETMNKNLPETLDETRLFGSDQLYFNFRRIQIDEKLNRNRR